MSNKIPKVGRTIVHDEEILILEVDRWGGYVSIPTARLETKMSDLFPEEQLNNVARNIDKTLSSVRSMKLKNVIKEDIKADDKMGWKRHQKVLRDNGYDV